MRLGQLARKLSIRPTELVKFLAENQIPTAEGSNTRLEDEQVALATKYFAPATIEQPGPKFEAPAESVIEDQKEADEPVVSEEKSVVENVQGTEVTEEKPELIKAPKVELPGLKVLGKIEFPEPRKKEPSPVAPESEEEAGQPEKEKKPQWERRKPTISDSNRRGERHRKNPIALERERQEHEAERKRSAEAELKKKLRKDHYLKKVKAPMPTKSLKLINDPVEVMSDEKVTPPRTGLGRFFKWLTS